jgi:hypothetical protein
LTDFGKSPAGFSPNNEAVITKLFQKLKFWNSLYGTASIDKKIMICIALHTFYIYKELCTIKSEIIGDGGIRAAATEHP